MTGETPVLGTLADLTAASVEHNSLAPREFMLVKMAALIPVDDRLSLSRQRRGRRGEWGHRR